MKTAFQQAPIARTLEVRIPAYEYVGRERKQIGLVEPAPAPEKTIALADFVRRLFPGRHIEHLGRNTIINAFPSRIGFGKYSLFFQTMLACYNKHYPLALRPEVLSYLINHEIAVTVNKHPDDYRSLFTSSGERQTIEVRDDSLVRGDHSSDWGKTLSLFEAELRRRVPVGCLESMIPGFSTDTPESRTATLIAFMDTVQSFYSYRFITLCGIPQIRLDGTAEDYQELADSAEKLAGFFSKHLEPYFRHLLPILRTIAQQAGSAETDNEFWSKIYSHHTGSGYSVASGWITAFLAYTPNKSGELMPKEKRLFDWANLKEDEGIPYGNFPQHISSVPFTWRYLADEVPMTFIGGVLGIENDGGFISPQLSYGVLEAGRS